MKYKEFLYKRGENILNLNMKKTYLFVTDTDFKNGNLTGAHKRFLELVKGISKNANIILVTREIPQLKNIIAKRYYIEKKQYKNLPNHVNGMINLYKKLKIIRSQIKYDYAISFGPSNTICLYFCGYKNIISLFREDLLGYQKVLGASKFKIIYSQFQERLAVKASDKIIVQCVNDQKNLIIRNKKYCKNIEEKVYIQINNMNASWMKMDYIAHTGSIDNKVRILFVGNFSDERKGQKILFPAIKKLVDSGQNIELLVAGDGTQLEMYKNKYKKYSEIKFLGRVNKMEQYYNIADFQVVPSLIDSCPNTVLEGLSAGIAVYGCNTGGIPDLLIDEIYLFESNDISLYFFLREVLLERRYILDAINQKKRREELTFDWSDKIQSIIECQEE